MQQPLVVHLLLLLWLVSCKRQEPELKAIHLEPAKYQIDAEKYFSFGQDNPMMGLKKSIDGNYLLLAVRAKNGCLARFSPDGDSLGVQMLEDFPTDYVVLPDGFYAVTTDYRTMGGPTLDFLNKYDRNGQRLWSKKINRPKFPDGHTVLALTDHHQLLFIADQEKPSGQDLAIRRFDLQGNLVSEKIYHPNRFNNPVALIGTADGHFLLAAETRTNENTRLWLAKLDRNGDTLWTRQYPDFYIHRALELKDSSLLFYGGGYFYAGGKSEGHRFLKIIKNDKNGRLLWQKSIEEYYYAQAGNMIETRTGNYLFSSSIVAIKDQGTQACLFETDDQGNRTYTRPMDDLPGLDNVPLLVQGSQKIYLYSQRRNSRASNPLRLIFVSQLHE